MTLFDRLSYLSIKDTRKLLGSRHKELLRRGGGRDIDISRDVRLTAERLVLHLSDATVTITEDAASILGLGIRCDRCDGPCEHTAAALALVLEEKLALGLAQPPADDIPIENLTEAELVTRALFLRTQRMQEESMSVESAEPDTLWTDYTVTSHASGKSYRVALRGWERGSSYCSCPDFMTNGLGTCKHILFVEEEAKKRFPPEVQAIPYRRTHVSISLHYGDETELQVLPPDEMDAATESLLKPLLGRPVDDLSDLLRRIQKLERWGVPLVIHADAETYIDRALIQRRLATLAEEVGRAPANHPLRTTLLKHPLLPYQMEGVAFAVGAGRAILADDMGLGKTVQAIGTAELLAREVAINRILVVCPASVKSQWDSEISRFTDRSRLVVLGPAQNRADQYHAGAFYTICNYEQVLRDIDVIERVSWDLIILDEGQRIKNWEAKTTRTIKGLRSPFALVLSGTPLENRLDELFSVVQFVDNRRLGPAYRFFHHHRVADEDGKILGYRNLDELRRVLEPVMLRRTRSDVLRQLPRRTEETRRILPTEEQLDVHNAHKRTVVSILGKKYISEMDLLRLQKALLMCRMAADSTLLVTKEEPGYSSKLQELAELLPELLEDHNRKLVLFSEWTSMLDLIEPLVPQTAEFVRLDGSVPQQKRKALVHRFNTDPECRVFLATNAGATGLNLQAADTVINVDLPWNPAVLEQRIARAHRMGQRRPVHVINLVPEQTLEESMLQTIGVKQQLADAVLSPGAEISEVALQGGAEELRRRLEVLVGEKPPAPIDESIRAEVTAAVAAAGTPGMASESGESDWVDESGATRERGAATARPTAGEPVTVEPAVRPVVRPEVQPQRRGVVGSVVRFFTGLFGGAQTTAPVAPTEPAAQAAQAAPTAQAATPFAATRKRLEQTAQRDADGRVQVTVTLPDGVTLDDLAQLLAGSRSL